MPSEIPIAAKVYRFADQYVQFRFRAELLWFETDPYLNEQGLETFEVQASHLSQFALEIAKDPEVEGAADKFKFLAEAIWEFYLAFQLAWGEQKRLDKVEEVRRIDPEEGANEYLYEGSPFNVGDWAKVSAGVVLVLEKLHKSLEECFRFGELLSSEVFPTLTFGQCSRTQSDVIYWNTEFNDELQKGMSRMREHFPFLKVKLDLSHEVFPQTAFEKIIKFHREIGELLERRQDVEGYLGLILDRRAGVVRRRGKEPVKLGGALRWKLLELLETSGEVFCSREALGAAWNVLKKPKLTETSLDTAIHSLRAIIKPLGIDIHAIRGEGLRLEKLPASKPHKQKPSSNRRASKGKRKSRKPGTTDKSANSSI